MRSIKTNTFLMTQHFFFKTLTIVLLGALGLLAVFSLAPPLELSLQSITTQKDMLFEVSNVSTVFAPPDTATVQIGVVREAETVEEVQTQLNTSNEAMMEAIRKVEGIEEENIKTVAFNIYPQYRLNPETGEQTIDGYQATSRLEVR